MRFIAAVALAGWAALARADDSAIRAALAPLLQGRQIEQIAPAPVPGLFEVLAGGQLYYATGGGRYVLGGPLVDVAKRVNLTEARMEQINAIAWDSLPLNLAIKRVKGKGRRHIAIFEDPDCPYCRVLEKTLASMDDLTIHVLLFPIDKLHPQAAAKSRAIWCAQDRAKAWEEAMRSGAAAGDGSCENPIAAIAAFAERHRINATPTSVLRDGRRLVGAIPRAELEKQLDRAQKP